MSNVQLIPIQQAESLLERLQSQTQQLTYEDVARLGAEGLQAESARQYEAARRSRALDYLAEIIKVNGTLEPQMAEWVWQVKTDDCAVEARLHTKTNALKIVSNGKLVCDDSTPVITFNCRAGARWPVVLREAHAQNERQRIEQAAHAAALAARGTNLQAADDYFANV